ncbi:MAG: DinB family protein [Planctomycetes bacterium]|nr:DinB family protein [Planctomycetota bacterium]
MRDRDVEESSSDPERLAERYLAAVEAFVDAMRRVPGERMDWRQSDETWSARDVAFHVADIDQMLGLRLRRILGEDNPELAGVNTRASVQLYRRAHLDIGLAIDAISATGALNTALIESLTPETMARKGRHSNGHDMTAADLAVFMAMHIEAHVRQIGRIVGSTKSK